MFQKVQNCLLFATKSVHEIMNIMNFIYFELLDDKINAEMITTVKYATLLQKQAESARRRNYTTVRIQHY